MRDLDVQTAFLVTALAGALCRQPGVDPIKLHADLLDLAETLYRGPAAVQDATRITLALMAAVIEQGRR